jgi:antitoxin MazE
MKTNLVRIGNLRGIRIPKAILEQCHLQDEVELEVRDDHLEVRPATKPRNGWADAFRRMHEREDVSLLGTGPLLTTQWEKTEWEW